MGQISGYFGADELPVHPCDVRAVDQFRAFRLAGISVGAIPETQFVHFRHHLLHTLFRFHLTLALLDEEDMKAADIPRLMRDHTRLAPNLDFECNQLAMFISDMDETDRIGFLTYKVTALG